MQLTPAQLELFRKLRTQMWQDINKIRRKRIALLIDVSAIVCDELTRQARQAAALAVFDKPEDFIDDLNLSDSPEDQGADDTNNSPELLRPDINDENAPQYIRGLLEQLKENLEQHWQCWERFVRQSLKHSAHTLTNPISDAHCHTTTLSPTTHSHVDVRFHQLCFRELSEPNLI